MLIRIVAISRCDLLLGTQFMRQLTVVNGGALTLVL